MANRVPGGTIRRAGILLVIILGAAVLSFAGEAYSHEEDDDGSVVVHVTDEGFEPRSITVEAGRTVVFENVGDEAHWPASDDHPTHQEYPGFDPKRPVQPGTEWSFTFDRPGEWGYHDHMNPYLTGEIVVRNTAGPGQGGLIASIEAFFANAYAIAASVFDGGKGALASAGEAETGGSAEGTSGELSEERYRVIEAELTALVREENPRVALEKVRREI